MTEQQKIEILINTIISIENTLDTVFGNDGKIFEFMGDEIARGFVSHGIDPNALEDIIAGEK